MGYQALLFSPDEKLGRIVTQVFTELDFTVEPAHEPFGAVKKLMAQHFDAIVVDCGNEQNAALLFKSARNSSFNQSSLAIAVVEGQAGVAKAYRIGANLVLTKPINVEQAKGTLRVARGLLRKNSDPAGGSAASVPEARPEPAVDSSQPASRGAAAFAPPQSRPDLLEFETPQPATTAEALPHRPPAGFSPGVSAITSSAKVDDRPAVPVPATQVRIAMANTPGWPAPQPASPRIIKDLAGLSDAARNEPGKIASASRSISNTAAVTASRSGAAPARAKEVTAPPAKQNKQVEWEPANRSQDADPMPAAAIEGAPLFSAFSEEEGSLASGRNRKILIAPMILALAALGYLGYGMLDKSSTAATLTPPPASTPQQPVEQNTAQPAPAPAPVSAPETLPSPGTPERASSATQTSDSKTVTPKLPDLQSAATGSPSVIRIALDHGAGTKKSDSAPLLVKSNPVGTKTQIQSADSAPPLPSPLAVASAAMTSNDNALSSLMSSASPTLPRPSLATTRISQGVSQGLLIKRVQPKYPLAALATHAQGAVQIEATIDKEGHVTNLKVLSGDPILAHAALDAVRQWRYKPYHLDGEPVEIQTQITVNFKAN
jgi:TonB family protein